MDGAVAHKPQQAMLGSRQAVVRRRVLFQQATDSRREEGKRSAVVLAERIERYRRGTSESPPGPLSEIVLIRANRLAVVHERRQFGGRQLSKPFELGTAGERVDANE